jgi:type I restriction enzyme S subunit
MPQNWKTYKLEDLCSKIYSGGTPTTKKPEYYNGDIPWLNTKEVDFKSIHETEKSITEEGLQNSSAKWVPKNAVIVAMYGNTAGKSAIAKIPLTTNQACCNLITDSEKADFRFVYYSILNDYELIKDLSVGGAQQNLNAGTIKNYEIIAPGLQEQKAIASILSALDDKIELNLQQNKTLEEMAMALYKHWFVDFGPFQDGEFVDSELGLIPKGWEVKCLKEISIDLNKHRKPISTRKRAEMPGQYPYYGATKILDYIDHYNFDGQYILVAEDGTVKTERDTPYLQFINGQFCVSNHAHVLTGTNEYSNYYLHLALANTYVIPFITGAVQLKISKGNLQKMQFAVAPIQEMQSFNNTVQSLYERIHQNENENQTLTNLRDTLLPKLISGQVRVKGIEQEISKLS